MTTLKRSWRTCPMDVPDGEFSGFGVKNTFIHIDADPPFQRPLNTPPACFASRLRETSPKRGTRPLYALSAPLWRRNQRANAIAMRRTSSVPPACSDLAHDVRESVLHISQARALGRMRSQSPQSTLASRDSCMASLSGSCPPSTFSSPSSATLSTPRVAHLPPPVRTPLATSQGSQYPNFTSQMDLCAQDEYRGYAGGDVDWRNASEACPMPWKSNTDVPVEDGTPLCVAGKEFQRRSMKPTRPYNIRSMNHNNDVSLRQSNLRRVGALVPLHLSDMIESPMPYADAEWGPYDMGAESWDMGATWDWQHEPAYYGDAYSGTSDPYYASNDSYMCMYGYDEYDMQSWKAPPPAPPPTH